MSGSRGELVPALRERREEEEESKPLGAGGRERREGESEGGGGEGRREATRSVFEAQQNYHQFFFLTFPFLPLAAIAGPTAVVVPKSSISNPSTMPPKTTPEVSVAKRKRCV